MNTTETMTDADALFERLSGKYRRIRARQEAITAELRKQHGEMDIAVPLIREVREEQ